jgi:hydrogenase expression/formation protein HypC
MCLAIPGKIVEIVDDVNNIVKVDVGGVRRNVNVGMLDPHEAQIGAYVLIHVGFAMSRIDESEAEETLRLLRELGAYEEEVNQFQSSMTEDGNDDQAR